MRFQVQERYGYKMKDNDLDLKQIEDIINILDGKVNSEVSRIKINTSQDMETGSVSEQYHHGRCDVGSPWATGKIKNEL